MNKTGEMIMKVNNKLIKDIAKLSKLRFNNSEEEKMKVDLEKMLTFVNKSFDRVFVIRSVHFEYWGFELLIFGLEGNWILKWVW